MSSCPLCDEQLREIPAGGPSDDLYDCTNCGRYRLTATYAAMLGAQRPEPKQIALLSQAIRRMQRTSGPRPLITAHLAEQILSNDRLPSAAEQFDNLVMYLGATLTEPGATLNLNPHHLRAVLGTITPAAASWVLKTCYEMELIEGIRSQALSEVTPILDATLAPRGWARFQELQTAAAGSRRAFMAMPFGDSELDAVFQQHFKPAAARAGFALVRLDEEPRAGLIDDRLRIEIRRSQFLVVELTHGNAGAYWEAGYAEGLGRPVIYTCKEGAFSGKVHFDTNHHLTVIWHPDRLKSAADLLTTTIRATLPSEATLDD